jgi:hypothetical protein
MTTTFGFTAGTAAAEAAEVATKQGRFTTTQIQELRNRVQATGMVILPVARTMAGSMFSEGVNNKHVFHIVRMAVIRGLHLDLEDCLKKWGIDQVDLTTSDGNGELVEEIAAISRDALLAAFEDWVCYQEDIGQHEE